MLYAVNAIAWAILSGVGAQLYQVNELDGQGEIVLCICVCLFVANIALAICE